MAIPPEYTVFQWMQKQASALGVMNADIRTIYKYWGSLTTAQRTTFRQQSLTQLDAITAALIDARAALTGL